MKKILILLTLLLSFQLFPADGEFRLLSFADYYGAVEPDESYETLRNRYYLQPQFQASLFGYLADVNLSANLWYQPLGEEEFTAPENILREAYVSLPAGNFDIVLGQKLASFGFSDVYGPLNIINASDQTIFSLDDSVDGRRPDGMVQILYYPNFSDTFELIYVPFPRPDYDPSAKETLRSDEWDLTLERDSQAYLTDQAQSLFFRYYHFSDTFDLQLVYAWYTEQTPGFDLSELDADGQVLTGEIEPLYTRNQLFGAAVSTTLGETILSEDLGFTLTEDPEGTDPGIANSSFSANTQITGSILNGTFAQLSLVYQYFINYDALEEPYDSALFEELAEEYNSFAVQPREHIAFAVLHLHRSFMREKLYLGLNTGLLYPDIYIAPRISYGLSDRMLVEAGADINTGGAEENIFTGRDESDNVYIRLQYEY